MESSLCLRDLSCVPLSVLSAVASNMLSSVTIADVGNGAVITAIVDTGNDAVVEFTNRAFASDGIVATLSSGSNRHC